MARTIPSSDIVFVLDSKSGFNNPSNLPVTFNDVDWTDEGFVFNGTTSYIDCGKDNRFNTNNEISVVTWVKMSSLASDQDIVRKGFFKSDGWILWFYSSTPRIYFSVYASTVYKNLFYSFSDTDTWNCFAGVYNNRNVYLYINGVLVSSDTTTFDMMSDITRPLTVGGNSNYFNGKISKVFVFNRALTSQEVADLYNKYTYGGYL